MSDAVLGDIWGVLQVDQQPAALPGTAFALSEQLYPRQAQAGLPRSDGATHAAHARTPNPARMPSPTLKAPSAPAH
jgi:hypothetical protein